MRLGQRGGVRHPAVEPHGHTNRLAAIDIQAMPFIQCKHFLLAQIADVGRIAQNFERVLGFSQRLFRGGHVDHDQFSVRLQHARHLRKRRFRLGKMMERQSGKHNVEGAVRKWQICRVAQHERHVLETFLFGGGFSLLQHGGGHVQAYDAAHARRKGPAADARSGGDLQKCVRRFRRDAGDGVVQIILF